MNKVKQYFNILNKIKSVDFEINDEFLNIFSNK